VERHVLVKGDNVHGSDLTTLERFAGKVSVTSRARGIHPTIRTIIIKYMDDDSGLAPKKILVRLNRDWKKKKNGFDFPKESFPQLSQVCFFLFVFLCIHKI
jgi:hypothetical protein